MPVPAGAPAWAAELALAFESGAHNQFMLAGNVGDRISAPDGSSLVPLTKWILAELLAPFTVVFVYDLGNGLSIERGREVASEFSGLGGALPRAPRPAFDLINMYLKFLHNLQQLERGQPHHVALVVRGADAVLPGGQGLNHDKAGLVSMVRDWTSEAPFSTMPFASVLITHNLADLYSLLARNPLASRLMVSLPDERSIENGLKLLHRDHPRAFAADFDPSAIAGQLTGATLAAVESAVKRNAHLNQQLDHRHLIALKKTLVEGDVANPIEFIETDRTLDDYHGQSALTAWLRQDCSLWRSGDLVALPMGYLLCGPVGTGKTYLVECLAGEAGVPVVEIKNFRDKWAGSCEGNLETIFRLIHALGRCLVFIDEADQALGKRASGDGDGGLGGRLYAMIAQGMSNTRNRGRIIWLLASSRPDLIEIDLKRPGRVDVKIPLLPTATVAESLSLVRALAKRRSLALSDAECELLLPLMPLRLTPGAAEALVVKAYRAHRTKQLSPLDALRDVLTDWQAPIPAAIMEAQMRLAIRETTDISFVPVSFRYLGNDPA